MQLKNENPICVKKARFGSVFVFLFAFCAVLACGAKPGVALGTCGPTKQPNLIGGCEICPGIMTPGSIGSAGVTAVFMYAGIQKAKYIISNNEGRFKIDDTALSSFNFKAPAPALISLPPVHGTVWPISYTAYPSIPNLTLSWADWHGGDSGVIVDAQLSGEIDIHISASAIVVNPTLTLTNLPVTITFGTDGSGNATISPSQVVVSPVGSYGSVNNCGAFGWCNGLVSGPIESDVQRQLQSALASQFSLALNGENNSSPFWSGFMTTLANQTFLSVLSDPAGYPLPLVNDPTPGGTATSWTVLFDFSYTGGKMTATLQSSPGLCYIDCMPKLQSQLCGPNSCGMINDGCGDTVACPGTCGGNEVCTNNLCEACLPLTCASAGITCGPIWDGCKGFITCNTCGGSTRCQNGLCVGFGGPNGRFCVECRDNGGVCNPGPRGTNVCIYQ